MSTQLQKEHEEGECQATGLFFNTIFWNSIGQPRVHKWTKNVNIFNYDVVAIPINESCALFPSFATFCLVISLSLVLPALSPVKISVFDY